MVSNTDFVQGHCYQEIQGREGKREGKGEEGRKEGRRQKRKKKMGEGVAGVLDLF